MVWAALPPEMQGFLNLWSLSENHQPFRRQTFFLLSGRLVSVFIRTMIQNTNERF